jgi:HEPN domain-containing protein
LASDPALLAEVRAWLRKASEDVRAAEVARAAEPPLREAAVFHCQQAAEKAIKGFLTLHARAFRRTHSIEEIGEIAVAIEPALRPVIDRAAPLTEYAWRFRYPGVPDEPALEEIDEAIAVAREVVREIIGLVPAASSP